MTPRLLGVCVFYLSVLLVLATDADNQKFGSFAYPLNVGSDLSRPHHIILTHERAFQYGQLLAKLEGIGPRK